jgi:hypothetical protein
LTPKGPEGVRGLTKKNKKQKKKTPFFSRALKKFEVPSQSKRGGENKHTANTQHTKIHK